MKKTLMMILFIALAISMMWGQTIINFDNADNWTVGSAAIGSYATDHTYVDGLFSATGGPALRNGTAAQDGFPGALGTYSWRLQNAANVNWIITISSGGVSTFSMDIRRWDGSPSPDLNLDYSTDSGTNWTTITTINNAALDNTSAWKTINGTVNSANENILIRLIANSAGERIMIDNFVWTGFSSGSNTPPIISNIVQTPATLITSSTTVSVSADVTDEDGTVELVQLKWGTEPGTYPNTISMTAAKGTYTTDTDIRAQADGTTVYYVVYAEDNEEGTAISAPNNYTVVDPATTTLPYVETFDADLGDCYNYTVSGIKPWYQTSGYAACNGYNGDPVEEHWLVLPGFDINSYADVRMTFDSWWRFGSNDENNYLKLFYSTNYIGVGNPSEAIWTELDFTASGTEQNWANSGIIDLSEISETSVYVAFKYRYETGNYRSWSIDNINIFEAGTPLLTVDPISLTGFEYIENEGPSATQSFTVSGVDLTDDINVSTSGSYELSLTSEGTFSQSIDITASKLDVVDTPVYVRLKAGLAIGSYNNEVVTISSSGAENVTVTCSGSVAAPPPEGYFVDFEGAGETKTSYASGNVTLSGKQWNLNLALIGTSASDWKNGIRSTRMQGYAASSMTMLEDKPNGAGTVSFKYRRYGTDPQVDWKVEISNDEGLSWSQLGDDFTAPASDDVQTFSVAANKAGGVRIRILRATDSGNANRRLNIDDIAITDYITSGSITPGVPVVIGGTTIDTTIPITYDSSLEIDDPSIPFLPNVSNLVNPVVIVFSAPSGTSDITLSFGAGTWYAAAFYNGTWNQGNPYPLNGPGNVVFSNVPFGAKGDVFVVVSENVNPTLPVELSSFNAIFSAENYVQLTWVTESETNVNGYYVYRSSNEALADASIISPLIDATNSSSQHTYNYKDSEIYADGLYYYWLQNVDIDGSSSYHGPVSVMVSFDNDNPGTPEIPMQTALNAVFPNPFNPSTNVAYSLAEKANVKISIFNSRGQLVKTLINADQAAGHHRIHWNGKDSFGNDCSSGIYFIRMQAGKDSFSRKALLMK